MQQTLLDMKIVHSRFKSSFEQELKRHVRMRKKNATNLSDCFFLDRFCEPTFQMFESFELRQLRPD